MKIKRGSSKWLVTLLSAVMVLSMAACSSGDKTAQKPEDKKPEGGASPKSEVKLTENDPGWKTDTSPITLDWYVNFSWFPNKWGVDPTSQYITKKTGVNVNLIVPAGNEKEKLNTMLASGKLPDLITIDHNDDAYLKMIDSKLVLPLNELAKEYDPYFMKVTDPLKRGWYTRPDGNVYGYPNFSSSPEDYKKYGDKYIANQTFEVRKDMYEAIGKPDMRTPEGFLKALQLAKEKFLK